MLFSLKNRVAIVTGAAAPRGIGIAIVKALLEQGATVIATDRDLSLLQNTVSGLDPNVRAEALDVIDEKGISSLFQKIFYKFQHIDILVNCAGITQKKKVAETTIQDWDLVQDINLKGTFLCSKIVVPYMQEKQFGRIVNLSSVSAKRGGGVFGGAHYSAAKAGILGFAKAYAREVAADNITINSVAPDLIATDIRGELEPEDQQKEMSKDIPAKRMGTADEVAAAVCFLASVESGYIIGEEIDINGGSHMD